MIVNVQSILIAECECNRKHSAFISRAFEFTILYSKYVTVVDGIIISNNIEGRGPSTDGIIDSSEYIAPKTPNINVRW